MGHKRISSYHGNSRGDAGSSYRRSSRREETNVAPQEDRVQTSPRRVERQDGQNEIREETREEGEIKSAGEEALALVSKEFQAALAETQAAGLEVISDPVDGEEGLQKIQSLLENDRAPEGEVEDVMEMDKIQAALLEHGLDMNAIDALPAVSEEGMIAGYEEEDQLQ
ncbi:BnaC05g50550D [Brassica napus]|uniref:BnaC05g50550D protein n=1 Tax=Brassica napus TaxID=3708 RepID=A0A078I8R1_BRANA|nr:BnaC05g50550D [Brassica napus]